MGGWRENRRVWECGKLELVSGLSSSSPCAGAFSPAAVLGSL